MSGLNQDEINFISSYFDQSVDQKSDRLYDELATISGRYLDREKLASGGMKEIYMCLDTATDREIAKAVLIDQTQPEAVEDFLREARLTARLQHPNIIPVYDIAKDEQGCPFFTMKVIKGQTLTNYRRTHPIHDTLKETWVETLNMYLRICEAVAYAHSKGILHLDIKPDNIQVSQYGEILVCDWGLARIKGNTIVDEDLANYMIRETMGRNLTMNGLIQGSPGYMAPEQADQNFGEKDEQTDIFSLGSLLYFLITGRTAIGATQLKDYIAQLRKGDYKFPSELNAVPESVEAICLKAMSVAKQDRYVCVNDMIKDVQSYLLGFAPSAEKAGFLKQCRLFYRRNQKSCLTAIVFLVILLTSALFYTSEINQSREETEAALVKVQKTNKEKTELIAWYKNGIMNSAEMAYKKKEYNTALNILKDLHFLDAKRMKAEIYLIKQDYIKADELLQGMGHRSLNEAIEFMSHLELNEEGKLHLEAIKELYDTSQVQTKFKRMILSYHLEFVASQEEKFEIIRFLMMKHNNLTNLNMKTELTDKGWYVDLSRNRQLRKPNWLEYLGDIDRLNISFTGMNSYRAVVKLNIRQLDAERVPINTFMTWVNPYLEVLNLAGSPLQSPPSVKYFRNLKTLILPTRLKGKKIEGLRRQVEVIYKN